MRNRPVALVLIAFIALFCVCLLISCKNVSLSSDIKCGQSCSSYQQSDSLPDQPSRGLIRLAIGGDSRNDKSHVVPWAFKEAKRRGAKAFFFLGDLELTEAIDRRFVPQFAELGDIPFYPVMGNHEVETLGLIRGRNSQSLQKVKKFKEEFLTVPGIHLAPFPDAVVYSVDLDGGIHFIALDNVSRKGEGFGPGQLVWLAEDLSAANADKKIILVGMHKGLANNLVTKHAMDEDGPRAVEDSNAALELLKHYKAAVVLVSHSHMYAAYPQDGLQVRLTGGMGAPLVRGLSEADGGFHHFLLVDVTPGDSHTPLHVQVVKFPCVPPCTPTKSETDESEEID